MKLEIQLDRDNRVPLTEQIVTGVTAWIRSRTAHPGAKLPSIRQFAADYGVSRFPVIEAYDRLVSLGYVDSRHGSGFYVADRLPVSTQCQGTSDPRRAEDESGHILQQFNTRARRSSSAAASFPMRGATRTASRRRSAMCRAPTPQA